MNTTIIYAHPWEESFNNAILQSVISALEIKGKEFNVIDLYKDNFNPVLSERDLSKFSAGETSDYKVVEYQQFISNSDELVFIFPVWWYDAPAILKGFIDKVMLKDFAYKETKFGLKGLLTNIKRTTVITTSGGPTSYIKKYNAVEKVFINSTLKSIGLKKVKWINFGSVGTVKNSKREKFLKKIEKNFLKEDKSLRLYKKIKLIFLIIMLINISYFICEDIKRLNISIKNYKNKKL